MVTAVNDVVVALNALTDNDIKGTNADLVSVKSNLVVPASTNGVTFTFTSSTNTQVNGTTGTVSRPNYNPASAVGEDDVTGDVTITGTKNGFSATRVFNNVTVLATTPSLTATMNLGSGNWSGGSTTYKYNNLVINDDTGNPINGLNILDGLNVGAISNETGDLVSQTPYLDAGILRFTGGLTSGQSGTFDLAVTDAANRTITITISLTQE